MNYHINFTVAFLKTIEDKGKNNSHLHDII